MTAIITGDIINSRAVNPNKWMTALKASLNTIGSEPKAWEIYRGDSFQLRIEPEHAILIAIRLKSAVRQFKGADVRMAIGIGEVDYEQEKITESNGTAFIRSGECFDALRKEKLAIKSSNDHFDKTINTMLALASLTMNNWTPAASKIISVCLEHPDKKQIDLAKMLNKPQSNISVSLKRSGFEEIQIFMQYFKDEIIKL